MLGLNSEILVGLVDFLGLVNESCSLYYGCTRQGFRKPLRIFKLDHLIKILVVCVLKLFRFVDKPHVSQGIILLLVYIIVSASNLTNLLISYIQIHLNKTKSYL
jgi:uncharacterized membrane protein YwzB